MMSFSLPRARLVAILLGRGLGTCCAALFSVAGLFLALVVVLGASSLGGSGLRAFSLL